MTKTLKNCSVWLHYLKAKCKTLFQFSNDIRFASMSEAVVTLADLTPVANSFIMIDHRKNSFFCSMFDWLIGISSAICGLILYLFWEEIKISLTSKTVIDTPACQKIWRNSLFHSSSYCNAVLIIFLSSRRQLWCLT